MNIDHSEAVQVMKDAGDTVAITISRDVLKPVAKVVSLYKSSQSLFLSCFDYSRILTSSLHHPTRVSLWITSEK